MAIRIRYYKYLDNLLSKKYFKTPDDEVYIQIEPDFSFRILNAEGNTVHKGIEKTLNAAKKAAKKVLISLEVPFEQECRPRIKRIPGC